MNDLISRQEAMAHLKHRLYETQFNNDTEHPYYEEIADNRIETWINELPSVQPEQKWIPCSERLPEEDTEVLISYRYKDGEGDTSDVNIDITSYGQMYFGGNKIGNYKHWRAPFQYFESNYEVIAWMPLPEPYGKEKR